MVWKKKAEIRGPRGYSVTKAVIGDDGHLRVGLDNGLTVDAGTARGPQGLPGVNAVENDSAVAAYLGIIGSATRTALAALFRRNNRRQVAFSSLRSAMDSGRPACFMWIGDSTGDSDGTVTSDLRTPTRLAQTLAAAYPKYHVLSRTLRPDGSGYGAPVVLQAAPAGQRYARFTGSRSLRYRPANPASTRFTTGDMDLRVLFKPDSAWASGATRLLVARRRKDVDGTATSTLENFRFVIEGSGTLRLDWSTDGATLNRQNNRSTVPITLPTDVPVWLRVTLAFTASGRTHRFFTSLDGQTWNELGDASGPWADAAVVDGSPGFFEIGAEGWQPASTSALGNIYEVEIRDGVNGPPIAPVLPELWERYGDATAATFGGAPTLNLINASRSGTTMAYHTLASRLAIETADYGQQVVVFNDSHNEGSASGPAGWTAPYRAWVSAVLARLPLAAPVVVLQNPHTSSWVNESAYGFSHLARMDELRQLAAAQRWGVVDLFEAFTNDPRGISALIQADGLHPTQAGYALAADLTAAAVGL